MTEKEKLLAGEVFNFGDAEIMKLDEQKNDLLFEYNSLNPNNYQKRNEIIDKLIGSYEGWINIKPPFHCAYGCNIHVGKNFFANFNFTVLDCGRFYAGDNCIIAPNVSIYTINHALDSKERLNGEVYTQDVRIGNNVWIGGNATLCPGVTLGDNVVVGAGAVVTKSFENNVLIAGNPAKIIKHLD